MERLRHELFCGSILICYQKTLRVEKNRVLKDTEGGPLETVSAPVVFR